ncbi:MAG: hypothetical protein O7A04_01840 [Acidobacteria bacterium]|nr:hypothetical protein [Acidobacteriota bacterium]
MTPRAIPVIKRQVRSLVLDGLPAIAEQCLEAESAREVEAILHNAGIVESPEAQ